MNDSLPLLIANFKANKNQQEVNSWLDAVGIVAADFKGTIIMAPSHPYLSQSAENIKNENPKINLASQDVSIFEQGAYTGEVAASQISNLCKYSIIGHSERRTNFKEDESILAKKVENAKAAGVEPIFCVQDSKTPIPEGVSIVAYEPTFAIGTGNPDTPENAKKQANEIKQGGNYTVLYGGSVTAQNVKSFLQEGTLDGALIGTASLDPSSFIDIAKSAKY